MCTVRVLAADSRRPSGKSTLAISSRGVSASLRMHAPGSRLNDDSLRARNRLRRRSLSAFVLGELPRATMRQNGLEAEV